MAGSAAYAAIADRLSDGGRVVLDGGIGTEVQRRGGVLGAWANLANAEMPDTLRAIHADFIAAGARTSSAPIRSAARSRISPRTGYTTRGGAEPGRSSAGRGGAGARRS